MAKHLINLHSNELRGGGAKLPEPHQIEYGEIAVNYAKGAETIAIRNSEDEIVTFKPGGGDDVYVADLSLLHLIMSSGTTNGNELILSFTSGDLLYETVDAYLGGIDNFMEAVRQNKKIIFQVSKGPTTTSLELSNALYASMDGLQEFIANLKGSYFGSETISTSFGMRCQNGSYECMINVPKTDEVINAINTFVFSKKGPGSIVRKSPFGGYVIDFLNDNKGFRDAYIAVGVLVIPPGVLPDGKARIAALTDVDSSGAPVSNGSSHVPWDSNDTSFHSGFTTKRNEIPIVDNRTNVITGVSRGVYTAASCALPSVYDGNNDRLTNPIDPESTWKLSNYFSALTPGPYILGGALNPSYVATNYEGGEINNMLSDFNGLERTRYLDTEYYPAAHAAHQYKANSGDTLEWYLPSAGEAGFLMSRLSIINRGLREANGNEVIRSGGTRIYWTSTETNSQYAVTYDSESYTIRNWFKSQDCSIRPFAQVDLSIKDYYDGEPDLISFLEAYTAPKLDRTDSGLSTESKDVIDVINEIVSYIGLTGNTDAGIKELIKDAVKEYLSGVTKQITLSDSGDTLSVGFSDDAVFGDADTKY